jgi:TrmH family RNA methyltransferase
MHDTFIDSPQNARVKAAAKLRNRRQRDKVESMLIEGYRELRSAISAGHPIDHVFYCPDLFLGSNEGTLLDDAAAAGTALLKTSTRVFEKLSYRDRPDGLLGVAPQIRLKLSDLKLPEAPLLLVAESIEKPGNLGTMLRTCDAVGVDAVIVCDKTTDINNPNVVRASVGTLFTQPVVEAGSGETIHFLKQRGIRMAAATPAAEANYWSAPLTGGLAVVVGSEQYGLTDQWLNDGDILPVRIPMNGTADSLNVATAASLFLYEALRQRSTE